MELAQFVANSVEEASRPLREEVASLKLLLARVGVSLEPADACSSGGGPATVLLGSTEQKSLVVEEEDLYSCFSSHGSHCQSPKSVVLVASESEGIDGILASVLQITPDSSVALLLVMGFLEAVAVAATPSPPQLECCQTLASLDCGGVLAPSSEALFAKELCGLLASLEEVSPGYGKEIACVLAGKASDDMISKVKKSLMKVTIRGKRRKRAVARKASAAN